MISYLFLLIGTGGRTGIGQRFRLAGGRMVGSRMDGGAMAAVTWGGGESHVLGADGRGHADLDAMQDRGRLGDVDDRLGVPVELEFRGRGLVRGTGAERPLARVDLALGLLELPDRPALGSTVARRSGRCPDRADVRAA